MVCITLIFTVLRCIAVHSALMHSPKLSIFEWNMVYIALYKAICDLFHYNPVPSIPFSVASKHKPATSASLGILRPSGRMI